MLYERICKDVNGFRIKAIRPITAALTCLLIELRLNGPVNNISVMLGLL